MEKLRVEKILPFVHLMTSFLIRLRNFKQVSRFQILHSEKRARARSYHIIIYIFEFLKNISVNLNKFILIPLNPCNSLYIYISILKITFISRRATSTFFHPKSHPSILPSSSSSPPRGSFHSRVRSRQGSLHQVLAPCSPTFPLLHLRHSSKIIKEGGGRFR